VAFRQFLDEHPQLHAQRVPAFLIGLPLLQPGVKFADVLGDVLLGVAGGLGPFRVPAAEGIQQPLALGRAQLRGKAGVFLRVVDEFRVGQLAGDDAIDHRVGGVERAILHHHFGLALGRGHLLESRPGHGFEKLLLGGIDHPLRVAFHQPVQIERGFVGLENRAGLLLFRRVEHAAGLGGVQCALVAFLVATGERVIQRLGGAAAGDAEFFGGGLGFEVNAAGARPVGELRIQRAHRFRREPEPLRLFAQLAGAALPVRRPGLGVGAARQFDGEAPGFFVGLRHERIDRAGFFDFAELAGHGQGGLAHVGDGGTDRLHRLPGSHGRTGGGFGLHRPGVDVAGGDHGNGDFLGALRPVAPRKLSPALEIPEMAVPIEAVRSAEAVALPSQSSIAAVPRSWAARAAAS